MPWCEGCDRFYNPNSVRTDGSCPSCGRQIGEPGAVATAEVPPAPWHFKLLLVAVVLYLGWRLLQGVVWVAERL